MLNSKCLLKIPLITIHNFRTNTLQGPNLSLPLLTILIRSYNPVLLSFFVLSFLTDTTLQHLSTPIRPIFFLYFSIQRLGFNLRINQILNTYITAVVIIWLSKYLEAQLLKLSHHFLVWINFIFDLDLNCYTIKLYKNIGRVRITFIHFSNLNLIKRLNKLLLNYWNKGILN